MKRNSQVANVTVVVNPVRQIPACSDEIFSVQRDSSTSFGLTVFDPDQDETYTFYLTQFRQYGSTLTKTNGGATIDATTTVIQSGVTTTNYYGEVDLTFTVSGLVDYGDLVLGYKVYDGDKNSSECIIQVNSSRNEPPVADPVDAIIMDEDGTSPIIVLNGTDNDPYLLYVLITDLPQHGILYQNTSNKAITTRSTLDYGTFGVYYVPTKLWDGKDNFTFAVKDRAGSVSPKLMVDITVNHVNHLPVIVGGGNVTTLEDTPILITQVLASDADGDRVYVKIKYEPVKGAFQQSDTTLITAFPATLDSPTYDFYFVPGLNENGDNYANFTVYGTDATGADSADVIVVLINVIAVDDPPVAVNVPFTANETTTVTAATIVLNATDVDTDPADIVATVLSLPSASMGVLKFPNNTLIAVGNVVPSREVVFETVAGYIYGETSFSFNVKDQTSYSANTATVSIVINHVNHDPTANNATVVAIRGVPATVSLSGYDPDVKTDVFKFVIDSVTPGTGGVFALSDNTVIIDGTEITGVANTPSGNFLTSITYTAPATAVGSPFANISYHIEDQAGGKSAIGTIVMNIAPNSAPVAIPVAFEAYQDTPSAYHVLKGTDADPADANNLLLIITSLPQLGVLIVNSTFNITQPNTVLPSGTSVSYYTTLRGSDSFSYHVEDNLGVTSGTVNAAITIRPVNHPPSAVFHGPATGLEDTNITINQIALSDPDGDTVYVYVTSVPTSGILTQYDGTPITSASPSSPVLVTEPHGWLIYVPAPDQFGDPIANFSFYADDHHGNNSLTATIYANITVSPVNDAPVAVNGLTSAKENAADILITLNVTDVDNNIADVSIYVTTLPDRSIGVLVDPNTLNPIQLLEKIPSRQVLLQLVPYAHGDTSFTFFANDGTSDSATGGIQTISIESVNQV